MAIHLGMSRTRPRAQFRVVHEGSEQAVGGQLDPFCAGRVGEGMQPALEREAPVSWAPDPEPCFPSPWLCLVGSAAMVVSQCKHQFMLCKTTVSRFQKEERRQCPGRGGGCVCWLHPCHRCDSGSVHLCMPHKQQGPCCPGLGPHPSSWLREVHPSPGTEMPGDMVTSSRGASAGGRGCPEEPGPVWATLEGSLPGHPRLWFHPSKGSPFGGISGRCLLCPHQSPRPGSGKAELPTGCP